MRWPEGLVREDVRGDAHGTGAIHEVLLATLVGYLEEDGIRILYDIMIS